MFTYTVRTLYALLRGAMQARRGGYIKPADSFATSFLAHPLDIDVNMHINNANYLRIAELARWQMVTQCGKLQTSIANKWLFLIAETHLKFHRGITPFSRYICTVDATHDGRKWITFSQKMLSPDRSILYAEIEVKAVIKKSSGKTVSPLEFMDDGGYDDATESSRGSS
eukprot:g5205.t1